MIQESSRARNLIYSTSIFIFGQMCNLKKNFIDYIDKLSQNLTTLYSVQANLYIRHCFRSCEWPSLIFYFMIYIYYQAIYAILCYENNNHKFFSGLKHKRFTVAYAAYSFLIGRGFWSLHFFRDQHWQSNQHPRYSWCLFLWA